MADQPDQEERTEPATGRKKEESRNKGKVIRSAEMNSAVLLVSGLLILSFAGAGMVERLSTYTSVMLSNAHRIDITRSAVQIAAAQGLGVLAVVVGPVALGLLVIGVAVNIAQVGFLLTFEPLLPKWSKLNPLHGLGNMFASRRSAMEMGKGIAKIAAVGVIAYLSLRSILTDAVTLTDADLPAIVGFMAASAFAVGMKVGIATLVLAGFDYMFQRFDYERQLRMTKQEVKEEGKMLEGDPLIKSRIKTVQRQIAYRRMMADVPKADVVVTNPTHLALALKYDAKKMSAPKVVAKGADLMAQRIRELAAKHGVPVMEDKPLAQALFKSVEVGEEVPEKLFQAVAQVLAYIYRLRDQTVKPMVGV